MLIKDISRIQLSQMNNLDKAVFKNDFQLFHKRECASKVYYIKSFLT